MMSLPDLVSQHHHDYVSLIQISDLHLFNDTHKSAYGINNDASFQSVLALATSQCRPIDMIVVSGDLCHEPSKQNYDRLFAILEATNIPYIAIPGNHDVTLELDEHLPFFERRHLPVQADERLSKQRCIQTAHWDVLFIDSSCPGKVYGQISQSSLNWLEQTLSQSNRPCIIFCHHPMALVNSQWIDAHTLINADQFWQVITPFQHRLKSVFVGHIHQETHIVKNAISVFGCPSTGVQFKPFCDNFTIDTIAPGLRWINLFNNGLLATGVKRIDTI